jgi:hypothetical protein
MAQCLSTRIAGCGDAVKKRNRELEKLGETRGAGGLGVFGHSFARTRIRIGPGHQADIPPMSFDSQERGDRLVETHVRVVPCMYVILNRRKAKDKPLQHCDTSSATEMCSDSECDNEIL